jgi:HicB family
MATMTIRMANSKHERLRLLAERQGISLNKLVDEWASMALAQFDAETRFRTRVDRGSRAEGLALLEKVEQAFQRKGKQRGNGKGRP